MKGELKDGNDRRIITATKERAKERATKERHKRNQAKQLVREKVY